MNFSAPNANQDYATVRNALCTQILQGNYANIINETGGFDIYADAFAYTAAITPTINALDDTVGFDETNENINVGFGLKLKSDPNC